LRQIPRRPARSWWHEGWYRVGAIWADGTIALIAVLLVVQMWLLTATLETSLAGHRGAAARPARSARKPPTC